MPIHRASNGESDPQGRVDPENTTFFFRSAGDTPGGPISNDSFPNGLEGAEKTASASPMHHPASPTSRQRRFQVLVAHVLDNLNPKYQKLLVARYFEGMTVEALGEELGITHQAVSSRLKTAQRNFVAAMAEAGVEMNRRSAA